MSEKLESIFGTYAYNPQQKNQLRLAADKRLNLDMMKDPRYDWEQMREISICMEYHIDPSPLCDPNIPSESMEEIRNHLFENQGVFLEAKEKIYYKRTKRLIISSLSLFIVFVIACIGSLKKDYIMSFFDDLDIVLVSSKVEVGLSQVKTIHYSDYVKSYNEKGELIIPNTVITFPGEHKLFYELKGESKTVKKSMILIVYDDIAPLISLKKKNIEITSGDIWDPRSNLIKAQDNIDGDLSQKVLVYSNIKTTPGKYRVDYISIDSSQNKAKETVFINVKAKPKNNQPKASQNKGGEAITKPNYKPVSKIFKVEAYGSFDKSMEACNNYIQQCMNQGYVGQASAQPIKKNGIYIGYQAVFN